MMDIYEYIHINIYDYVCDACAKYMGRGRCDLAGMWYAEIDEDIMGSAFLGRIGRTGLSGRWGAKTKRASKLYRVNVPDW